MFELGLPLVLGAHHRLDIMQFDHYAVVLLVYYSGAVELAVSLHGLVRSVVSSELLGFLLGLGLHALEQSFLFVD